MAAASDVRRLLYGTARVEIYPSRQALGLTAAAEAARLIAEAARERGRARIIVATGNSQLDVIPALVDTPGVPWKSVEVFHLDDYIGMPPTHPSSFRYWIKHRIEDRVHPGVVNYIVGDAADLDLELERYAALLNETPIDLAFVGFGENGHIAFNDPHVADFDDPLTIKRVAIDEASRRQQAGEGHFESPAAVPQDAITVTCSALLRARAWICAVPELRKAPAVRDALEGTITTKCPASIVRQHPHATVYLDRESASLLASYSKAKSGT
jgi:glucosamine-6-phosphate deaminase